MDSLGSYSWLVLANVGRDLSCGLPGAGFLSLLAGAPWVPGGPVKSPSKNIMWDVS